MKLDMTFHQTDQSFAAEFERLQAVSSVISVNGKTGAVQLTAEDVGALAQDAVQTKAIICTASDKIMKAEDSAEYALKGLTLYGKTTQNGTPTLDAPVALKSTGDGGSIAVTVTGKNLFDAAKVKMRNKNETDFVNGDIITCKFTSGAAFFSNTTIFPAGTYTISVFSDEDFSFTFFVYRKSNGSRIVYSNMKPSIDRRKFTFTADESFYISVGGTTPGQGGKYGTYTFRLQLEAGTTATEYEAYKQQQVLTAKTPNGLPGIPVTSGGSYTDENGQQWLCDEIDFAKGVYVHRIARIDSYTGEAVGDAFLSTTGELSKGATVLYPLAEVLETALTEEDLAQYTALHTYYPVTTVLNDGGAQMKLGYVADTKNYIDKKFIELQNAILSLGGNV